MKCIIVSGRSGSGKSICLHVLEDLGYYCVDNLPMRLLPDLLDQLRGDYDHIAVGIDVRNLPKDLDQFNEILTPLAAWGVRYEVVYMDADDETLLQRFDLTRRKHPLTGHSLSLVEALQVERDLLKPIAMAADLQLNTSTFTIHDLRDYLRERIADKHESKLSLMLQSFGFKFGVPTDTDFVFDMRCLPNPYWEANLSGYSGLDQPVKDFLRKQPSVAQMIKDVESFLTTWVPRFEADNRSYLTVSFGCTGGQHRSVFITEYFAELFREQHKQVQVRHREIS